MNITLRNWVWTFLILLVVAFNIAAAGLCHLIYSSAPMLEPDIISALEDLTTDRKDFLMMGVTAVVILLTVFAYAMSVVWYFRRRPYFRLFLLTASATLLGVAFLDEPLQEFSGAGVLAWVIYAPMLIAPVFVLWGLEWLAGRGFLKLGEALRETHNWLWAGISYYIARSLQPDNEEIPRELGLILYRQGKFASAENYLRPVYASGDRTPDVLRALGEILVETSPSEAADMFNLLVYRNPKRSPLSRRLIELYRRADRIKEALDLMEQVYNFDKSEDIWRYEELTAEQGNVEKSLELILRAVAVDEDDLPEARRRIAALMNTYPENPQILKVAADLAERAEDDEKAVAHLEHLLILEPNDAPSRLDLIRLYKKLIRFDDALLHFRLLFKQQPPTPDLTLEYIEVLDNVGKDEEALEEALKACDNFPQDAQTHLQAASMLYARGELDRAQEIAERIKDAEMPSQLARKLSSLIAKIESAKHDREIDELARRREEAQGNIDLTFEYIDRLIEYGRMAEAVTELEQLLEDEPSLKERILNTLQNLVALEPPPSEALSFLADLRLRESDCDGALKLYQKMADQSLEPDDILLEGCHYILRIDPEHFNTYMTLAGIASRREEWDAALEYLNICESLEPQRGKDYLPLMVKTYYHLDDLEHCRIYAKQLIDVSPRLTETYKLLGALLIKHEFYKEAADVMKKGRQINSMDQEMMDLEAEAVSEYKKRRLTELRDLVEAHPERFDYMMEMADLFFEQEKYEAAIPLYDRAKKDSRLSNLCHAKIAVCLARRRLYDLAEETTEDIEWGKKDDMYEEEVKKYVYNVAVTLENNDRPRHAHRIYKRIFKMDAGYRNVVQRIESLAKYTEEKG